MSRTWHVHRSRTAVPVFILRDVAQWRKSRGDRNPVFKVLVCRQSPSLHGPWHFGERVDLWLIFRWVWLSHKVLGALSHSFNTNTLSEDLAPLPVNVSGDFINNYSEEKSLRPWCLTTHSKTAVRIGLIQRWRYIQESIWSSHIFRCCTNINPFLFPLKRTSNDRQKTMPNYWRHQLLCMPLVQPLCRTETSYESNDIRMFIVQWCDMLHM